MTNSINVPRELLAELQEHIDCHRDAVLWGKVCALLSTPSPAGVDADHVEDVRAMVADPSPAGEDGLEVVATLLIDDPTDQECGDWDIEVESKVAERMSEHGGGQHELCRLSDATAIIDGLRGEVANTARLFHFKNPN